MSQILDHTISGDIKHRLDRVEKEFDGDALFYYGPIHPTHGKDFRDSVEILTKSKIKKDRLVVLLNTPGGSAETVEEMVIVTRHAYKEVYFVVPDYAMSAGTILCMSGDKIFMDYSSSLGPIDPQVFNGKRWVPALGYLDKIEELIEKSSKGNLTRAEYVLIQNTDLAELRSYEQARDLTTELLKDWLVRYRFKDWKMNAKKQKVTKDMKIKRADMVAKKLSDNKIWHSHARSIDINKVKNILGLEIEDYSNSPIQEIIRNYNDLVCDYIQAYGLDFFINTRLDTIKTKY